jgi:MoaA/NifB/PqqE/SkfB family radical SAM enzyme
MSIAGSKGGIYPQVSDPAGREIPLVRFWEAVGARQMSGRELYRELARTARPVQVELGIGNTCGLECAHCFLGYSSGPMAGSLVPLETLATLASDLVRQMGTQIFCLTDRDALTPGRSVPFLRHLASLRAEYPELIIGGVTNGLAIDKYADDLRSIHPDYLDVSLDGTEDEHDAMRGTGTYARTLANIRLALSENLATRLVISSTLSRWNAASLLRMVEVLSEKEGVQWFDIGPLMAVKMQPFQLRERDVAEFLFQLRSVLERIRPPNPVTVFMEICAYCSAFIPGLVDSGWLVPDQIRQDRYGHLYQEIRVQPNVTIILRPELIPEYWRYSLRITADGFLVGGCELLTQPDYARLAVGNVKQESIQGLYAKAMGVNSPFYRMMLAYDLSECRNKPCFLHCLGGDSLLSASVYRDYARKDPNCVWDEYEYTNLRSEFTHAAR